MKNNIKIIIGILAVIVILGAILAYSKKNTTPSEESIVGTYVANLGNDVYTLEISSQEDEQVEGSLVFNNFEKDSSAGTLSGTYTDDILLADYTFESEGMGSVMQVIFMKQGDSFIRGYGKVDEATGSRFEDLDAVTYDESVVFQKVAPDSETASAQPTTQGKINIDVVCENTLTYMTFIDGASADAFVAECKDGKHPDVIDAYIAGLELGTGVAI